jgi:2-hydroxychromene-2-carboxylate isomerase
MGLAVPANFLECGLAHAMFLPISRASFDSGHGAAALNTDRNWFHTQADRVAGISVLTQGWRMSEIEYFYGAQSAFAYLGAARFMAIARAAGRRIRHRPIDLGQVVGAAHSTGFGERSAPHRAYFFGREIERWAEHRGVAFKGGIPASHRNDSTQANCLLLAAAGQGLDVDGLALRMMQAHWRDHADLGDGAVLRALLESAGIDPGALREAARSPQVLAAFQANTAEAIERSVFGSPTYFVDGDMFYGQDRLEMVERALERPYARNWP